MNCFLLKLNTSYRCDYLLILDFQENVVSQLTWFDSYQIFIIQDNIIVLFRFCGRYFESAILNYENLITNLLPATPKTLSSCFLAFFSFCDHHLESAILNYEIP